MNWLNLTVFVNVKMCFMHIGHWITQWKICLNGILENSNWHAKSVHVPGTEFILKPEYLTILYENREHIFDSSLLI